MSDKYDDIIHLPHHVSKTRPQMPALDRAAQFAPFAALTGHGAAIAEAGRLTEQKRELAEHEQAALNEALGRIQEQSGKHPIVTILYFMPDERKAGGAYLSATGEVKRICSVGKWTD